MAFNFFNDYLFYNSGNMVPRRYHLWSAASLIAAAAGRRFYIDHGYFQVHCMLLATLVGRQGLRKSTAKDLAKELFIDAFPDYPIGPSVQSREDLVKRLAGDDWLRMYKDEHGNSIEWKPLMFFVNELKNFLSINPALMIDTLTDLYGQKFYDASTIKHGLQTIINPCINILACETPRWIIDKFKLNIITGGFSRRMLLIYETTRPERVTFPKVPEHGLVARERCKQHLQKISTMAGEFHWDKEGRLFFDKWFKGLQVPDDEILEGYYENKDILAQKLTMIMCLAEENPQLILTKDKLSLGIAFLESIEDNLPKLTVAAGRSEVAVPQQRILEVLLNRDGMMPEKMLYRETQKDFKNPMEQISAIRFMIDNEQIVKQSLTIDKVQRVWLLLPERWKTFQKNGDIETKEKNGP